MFERAPTGERVLLLEVEYRHPISAAQSEELTSLAVSAGAQVVDRVKARVRRIDPHRVIGQGTVANVGERIIASEAELVIVDFTLSPSQERNLEQELKCRVIDRQGLILDIFARRAETMEGQLQVELAQLNYLSTRLVRGWTHLERQKGGIGLRGPGETQLETDRRLIRERIRQVKRRLAKVHTRRELGRRQRARTGIPRVAIVGYTNVGKSTLFNSLTDADVRVADQVFATLDTTTRRCPLPSGRYCLLSDTVGFVRDLPHSLIEAFQGTLMETRDADLLLHVVDRGDPEQDIHRDTVNDVLREIGAESVPQLVVFNKIDTAKETAHSLADAERGVTRVYLSAERGDGIDLLKQAIEDNMYVDLVEERLSLPSSAGALRAWLYELGAVKEEKQIDDDTMELLVAMRAGERNELQRRLASKS